MAGQHSRDDHSTRELTVQDGPDAAETQQQMGRIGAQPNFLYLIKRINPRDQGAECHPGRTNLKKI